LSLPPVWQFQTAIFFDKITKKRVQFRQKVGNKSDTEPELGINDCKCQIHEEIFEDLRFFTRGFLQKNCVKQTKTLVRKTIKTKPITACFDQCQNFTVQRWEGGLETPFLLFMFHNLKDPETIIYPSGKSGCHAIHARPPSGE